MKMQSHIALILGGNKGFGPAMARVCRRDGLKALSVGRGSAACDISDELSVERLLADFDGKKYAVDRFFWIDDAPIYGLFAEQELHAIHEAPGVHLFHELIIARWVWRQMCESRRGRKLFGVISSARVKRASAGAVASAVAQARYGFAKALGLENANQRVTVFSVTLEEMNPRHIGGYADMVAQRILADAKRWRTKWPHFPYREGHIERPTKP